MDKHGIQKPVAGASPASVPATGAGTGGDDGGDLDPGDTGPRVTKLQEELAERGFYKGAFDGNFGPKTADAVVAFKKANNLPAGPKVGAKVRELLGIGL
jgi:peptidoglycan hydrolase-like protein with peptidoglycan-binding domain